MELSLIVKPKKLKFVTLSILVFSIFNDNGSTVLFTCLNIINLDFFVYLFTFSQPLILFSSSFIFCSTEFSFWLELNEPNVLIKVVSSAYVITLNSSVDVERRGRRLFFRVRAWLVMTFNYLILWVRIKG